LPSAGLALPLDFAICRAWSSNRRRGIEMVFFVKLFDWRDRCTVWAWMHMSILRSLVWEKRQMGWFPESGEEIARRCEEQGLRVSLARAGEVSFSRLEGPALHWLLSKNIRGVGKCYLQHVMPLVIPPYLWWRA